MSGIICFESIDLPPMYLRKLFIIYTFARPILNGLMSLSTGGRIDQPMFAVIGDGAKLGSPNREWIFNDTQLITTVQMAVAGQNKELVMELQEVRALLSSQRLETRLKGDTITLALTRNQNSRNARSR